MFVVLTGGGLFVSGSVAAQSIVVNGVPCPGASVKYTLAGPVAVLPTGCSGNGNPCANVVVTYSPAGISVQANASCLTAVPVATPVALQNVTVNGSACNSAKVRHSGAGIAVDAPAACLSATPPTPLSITPAEAYVGQTITVNGSGLTDATASVGGLSANLVFASNTALSFNVPAVATGSQTVTVSIPGRSLQALPLTVLAPSATLAVLGAQSRKSHGPAGDFYLPIDTTQAVNGSVTVEPRALGSGHYIVFQFNGAVTSLGTVTAVDQSGAALTATASPSGNAVVVTLSNVPNNSRATISLAGVNGTLTPAPVSIGFLLGDVNNSRSVTSSDINSVKARSGQLASASKFLYDVNLSGSVTSADISMVKANSGLTLQ